MTVLGDWCMWHGVQWIWWSPSQGARGVWWLPQPGCHESGGHPSRGAGAWWSPKVGCQSLVVSSGCPSQGVWVGWLPQMYQCQLYLVNFSKWMTVADHMFTDHMFTDHMFTDHMFTDHMFTDHMFTDHMFTDQLFMFTSWLTVHVIKTNEIPTVQKTNKSWILLFILNFSISKIINNIYTVYACVCVYIYIYIINYTVQT